MIRCFAAICGAFLLLCGAPASAQSDAELRDMAATFGLTPVQADLLFTRYTRQKTRMSAMAAQWSISVKTLQAAAITLGSGDPSMSDQDFLRLVEDKAKQAKLATDRITALSEQLARLDPGGTRTRALVVLARGEEAFKSGNLKEAAEAFNEIEALHLNELSKGHDPWIESVFANALVNELSGNRAKVDHIYDAATAQAEKQAAQGLRDAWSFQVAKAGSWFEQAQRTGDPEALNKAESILNNDVVPRVKRDKEPANWARTQWLLGAILTLRGMWESNPAKLKRALAAYDSIDQSITPVEDFDDWAAAQGARAATVSTLFQQQQASAADMNRSLTALREAISLDNNRLTADTRSKVHGNAAIILMMLGSDPPDITLLRESDQEFRNALAGVEADDIMSIGQIGASRCNVLLRLGSLAPGPDAFDNAVSVCEKTMNGIPIDAAPYLNAAARSNWGNALMNRGMRKMIIANEDRLREALDDFMKAEDVFSTARDATSRVDHPGDWAKMSLFLAQTKILIGVETRNFSYYDDARAEIDDAKKTVLKIKDASLNVMLKMVDEMLGRARQVPSGSQL